MRWKIPAKSSRALACAGLLIAALSGGASAARAQALASGRANRGMNLYESFAGSSSSSGTVFNMSNALGHDFTAWVGMDITVPVYFVLPPSQKNGFAASATGLGNLSVDGRLTLDSPVLDYLPTATITFPTGSTTKGFSTGSVTYDFDNRFEHECDPITPFLDVDVGNSLNNGTSRYHHVIQRPYLTLGKVANFMVGTDVRLTDRWTVSGDAYKVVPWGPQTVFSRIVRPGKVGKGGKHQRTYEIVQRQVGGAGIVDDDGFDASVAFSPNHYIDLTLAFDRSIHYALNTISFSVGFNISQILSRGRD
jgi:hypothetical protein